MTDRNEIETVEAWWESVGQHLSLAAKDHLYNLLVDVRWRRDSGGGWECEVDLIPGERPCLEEAPWLLTGPDLDYDENNDPGPCALCDEHYRALRLREDQSESPPETVEEWVWADRARAQDERISRLEAEQECLRKAVEDLTRDGCAYGDGCPVLPSGAPRYGTCWACTLRRALPTETEGEGTMTPEEREAQRRSFAYGNAKISNDLVTRDMVDRAATVESLDDVRWRHDPDGGWECESYKRPGLLMSARQCKREGVWLLSGPEIDYNMDNDPNHGPCALCDEHYQELAAAAQTEEEVYRRGG